MKSGGDRRPLAKLIAYFKDKPLADIGQGQLDAAAADLFLTHSAATRNREVYTPVSSILKHAGHPCHWRAGNRSTSQAARRQQARERPRGCEDEIAKRPSRETEPSN